MTNADVAAYVARWQPSSVSAEAAAFARDVIAKAGPGGRERAKNLLWAAGKLADWAIGLGLDPVPDVLLHPSVGERFTRCAAGLTGVARRTLRTNLRFIGRRVVPQLYPADLPLPRERAKAPYGPAQIAGFLALADAQPAWERRMRAAGLVCLGLVTWTRRCHARIVPDGNEPGSAACADYLTGWRHPRHAARRRLWCCARSSGRRLPGQRCVLVKGFPSQVP